MSSWEEPWLIMGDFNEILNIGEKFGGKTTGIRKSYLNEFFQNVGALDLEYTGKRFTWENRQEGRAYVKGRLDRFIANRD